MDKLQIRKKSQRNLKLLSTISIQTDNINCKFDRFESVSMNTCNSILKLTTTCYTILINRVIYSRNQLFTNFQPLIKHLQILSVGTCVETLIRFKQVYVYCLNRLKENEGLLEPLTF